MANLVKRIGTHDGVFHCDEVLACFLLRKLPEYVCSEIVRTRDQGILDACDVVVDVGGVYDPDTNRFDHHQRGFTSTMNSLNPNKPWCIKLSSAGLVYFHFGEKILRSLLGPSYDDALISRLYDYLYENLIQEVDAIDNGVEMFDGEPRYRIRTNLSSRVSHLNPAWNDKEPFDSLKGFHNAMDFVGKELIEKVQYFIKSWWPARKIVEDALLNRLNVHSSGAIMVLETFCPWQEHLHELEKEIGLEGTIKYVLFLDKTWRVQCVPVSPSSFRCRLFLPEKWRGLKEDELVTETGIDGCIFVHAVGFIGSNKTKEGAMEMAVKALLQDIL